MKLILTLFILGCNLFSVTAQNGCLGYRCKNYDYKSILKWITIFRSTNHLYIESEYDSIVPVALKKPKIDTLTGVVYCENIATSANVDAYANGDVYVKQGDLLPKDSELYTQLYVPFDCNNFMRKKYRNLTNKEGLTFDKFVLNTFNISSSKLDSLQKNSDEKLLKIYQKINFSDIKPEIFNVSCDVLLSQCYVKFTYIQIGELTELTPLMMGCEELNRYEKCVKKKFKYDSTAKVNFQYKRVKIAWITDILEFKILEKDKFITVYDKQIDN